MTIYIKKDEFKDTKHVLKNIAGRSFVIEGNEITDKELYERHKFMFDVVEEVIKPVIEIKKEVIKPVVEPEIIKEEIIEPVIKKVEVDLRQEAINELNECSTLDHIYELALEYDLDLDMRLRNISKVKENFKEELENKEF